MTAQIIDGNALASATRNRIADRVVELAKRGLQPGLAVVLVGEDPASAVYVRNKVSACQKVGFKSEMHRLPADVSETDLLILVERLNQDDSIHGILVQLPLPAHIDAHAVIETISSDKDVDGFHVSNAGLLMTGKPLYRPCTPYGVMEMLESTGVNLAGAEAVVVGASNIVGKPQAMLLLAQGATVTLCNSKTKNLAAHCQRADVLIVAVGRPGLITADMVKPGAIVIDVGINRLDDGKLCGDVDFEAVRQIASWISPVPGGVGPMTIAMLLQNTLEALERPVSKQSVSNTINPLLDFDQLPRFNEIKTEHIKPAIETLLEQARNQLEKTAGTDLSQVDWEDTLVPLDRATEKLSRAWGVVSHLHSVADHEALRSIYNECLPKITEFWTVLGQDKRLYEIYKSLKENQAYEQFSSARRKVVENAIRGFKLSGAELAEADKPRYTAIQDRLATISAKFSENVLDSTSSYSLVVSDAKELAGLPEYALEAAQALAKASGEDGYKFTLQFPSYFPVLQYCENANLRETLYEAYAKRASEFGPKELDNTALIEELLQLRAEESQLLGFKHYGEMSLVTKMADSAEEVCTFLRELAGKAKPFAQKDLSELREFARQELAMQELHAWDVAFVSEKLKQQKYAFSDLEVRKYFQEDKVLAGLFELTGQLFKVQIKPAHAQTWHEDVRFFEVLRDSQVIAHFYLDPYARENKRSGAWMDDARGRRKDKSGGLQTPVAYLTCNYTKPSPGKSAQLSHDDVQTLFHEFGHGIHHMLTRVDELDVAGISGVEWDAVELPSQFMENFAWEWSVVESLTAHEQTNEPMPKTLFEKMIAAKNFQSGLQTMRQIEFSLFDMLIHTDLDPHSGKTVMDVLAEVKQEVAVMQSPAYSRFPNSFSHIFAGGYAAGYYSYKWAEVLSADAFAFFEETGINNPTTGQKFLDEILSVGGSRPAAESFLAFRGRPPSVDALLRHTGMVEDPQIAAS